MSRHRFVKNINIDDELEDDALSDGGEEDLAPEQQEQLDIAIARTRSILGPEESSGISNAQIRDAAWEFYFDVEKTVEWLLEEQIKRDAAKEKKDPATASSSQAPLSALQRLSLAHKKSAQATKPSLLALALAHASNRDSSRNPVLASTPSPPMASKPIPPDLMTRNLAAANGRGGGSHIPVSSTSRPGLTNPSKLSLLAKAKASQSTMVHTSLSSPPHTTTPTPLGVSSSMSVKGSGPSKLALKIQKARDKPATLEAPVQALKQSSIEFFPLFHPSPSRMQAAPSPFAQLLLPRSTAPGASSAVFEPENAQAFAPRTVEPLFVFDAPSPDDIVLNARRGTPLASPAREREKAGYSLSRIPTSKAKKTPSHTPSASTSRAASPMPPQHKSKVSKYHSSLPVPPMRGTVDQQQFDMASLNLQEKPDEPVNEEPPKMTLAREKVLEEARSALEGDSQGKIAVSLVVIGHVDAGKSTLMGRLLYELGRVDEKRRTANERASSKLGKGSFSWAWELDGTIEERQRGVTMDIALQTFSTTSRNITVLDAPGHRDFIPNMISGASQADCALLVVDASSGEFEAGFQRGGQTKEHILLVRSLGVSQVVVAVNKLDQVNWDRARYEEIVEDLRPFLVQSGFPASKARFVPVSATAGVNLVNQVEGTTGLRTWYNGPTLVDLLDELDPPTRLLDSPLRVPVSNVFRGQASLSSGLGVSGRLSSGVVQVGERLRVLPGDESTVVRLIEQDESNVPWAAAGSNVTLYLSAIDPIHVSIGTVLCPPTELVPLVTKFVAQIVTFDIELPITAGASIELFYHSRDVPATLSKLIATLDRATSVVVKHNPRVLSKLVSAKVEVTLRGTTMTGPSTQASPIPLETFKTNKDMGRVLLRRGGETIAAGIVLELL